ncbi:hypothetical protein [Janibacter sp. GS2]|uniref:hypothetical protein n=1 Tax=Janibacter sp. GS2 TaxID=3442646 RepID=UPI003EBFB25C
MRWVHSPRGAMARRQRTIVVVALVLTTVFAVTTVSADERADAAVECGPGDSHRNDLTLGATDQSVTPCVSGSNLNISVPKSCLLTICENKYKVREIRRHGRETVTYSDGTSEELLHFTFKELTFRRDVTMRTDNNAAGQLSLQPEGVAHIGGASVGGGATYTDVWVSGGTFNITFTDLPSVLACTIPVPANSPLVEIVQGGTIRGCGIDLDVKYLVSYDEDASSGRPPIRLPRTTLEVTR